MVPMSDEQRNDDRPQGLCGKGSQSDSGLSGSGLGSGDNPPYAKQEPHRRIEHGDAFDDPYEWMRDKDSPELAAYVAAQNAYCERRMAPLHHLRETLFKEFTSHVQETDMSVPTRVNDYWYFPGPGKAANTPHPAAFPCVVRMIGIRHISTVRPNRVPCPGNRCISTRTKNHRAMISSASAAWT